MIVFCLISAICGSGCGSGSQKLDEGYMQNAEALGKQRREIFMRANGDYDAMSPSDKEAFLSTFKGDETNAKKTWEVMKSPPTSSGPPQGVNQTR